ncbi:MAG TPA: glycosyltransferase family 4 protein [Gemmatimonadales bacterium]|nr:glycosyltransferase family 4 protein [Gemmatimonadales bacterium]
MRIALVAEDYYPQLGGVPEHVHNVALQLNRWGHTATVVTSHMGAHPDADFVRRVGRSRVIYANGGVSRVTTGWRLRRRLEEVFRAGRYDIVHVHGGLAPTLGLAAPLAAWRAAIPVVATFHSWFARSIGCRVFRRPLQKFLDRHAATIAVSRPVVEANSRYFHADWEIIPNGVDTDFFRPNGRESADAPPDAPRLLFLGRIEPRNGLGTLLDAMPRILARYPKAVLTVAGDGPWRGYYERRARELGASVRFVGQVFTDRPAYYGSADLYLCPTTIASFGVTLLEAMACGTPMIVSDNVGFRSVIAGGSEAMMIPKDDPAAWAEATIALLGDPARRAAMGRAGRRKAALFAWPRIAQQELAVYERVLAGSAKAGTRPASDRRYVRVPRKTSVMASTSR